MQQFKLCDIIFKQNILMNGASAVGRECENIFIRITLLVAYAVGLGTKFSYKIRVEEIFMALDGENILQKILL